LGWALGEECNQPKNRTYPANQFQRLGCPFSFLFWVGGAGRGCQYNWKSTDSSKEHTDPHRTKLDPRALKVCLLDIHILRRDIKCYCPELDCFIIFADITFFESKPYFDTDSHSSERDEDFLYFLVQEHLFNNYCIIRHYTSRHLAS